MHCELCNLRSNWKCLWNSWMSWNKTESSPSQWWLGALRQWWRQPLHMAIMCTAICCLCTGEGSDPGTTPQWGGGGANISRFCFSVITAAMERRIPQSLCSRRSISLFWKCSHILIIQWYSHNGNNAAPWCKIDINTWGRPPFFMLISRPSLRLWRW